MLTGKHYQRITINLHKFFGRNRHYFRIMNYSKLLPPQHVRLMTCLDRNKFNKTVKVPVLYLTDVHINSVLQHLKTLFFKMERLKPIQLGSNGQKKVVLHPMGVNSWEDVPNIVKDLGITQDHFAFEDYELTYYNWKAEEILRAVLPEDQETSTSFSLIGHIVHLNLRDHLLPYKKLIGEVLLDKVAKCKTVINKCQSIENTFRNFQIEVLSGEQDFKVNVKENGAMFEFDFSTVYWNPRLSTEHERITKLLCPGDVLYDVFAGVGPFSIPAGKKSCTVLANDLNPESFKWLQTNIKRNGVTGHVTAFNKDGKNFICDEIRNDLIRRWKSEEDKNYNIHITMNLPVMAVEFLNSFRGLLNEIEATSHSIYPLVHVYCFAKGENSSEIAKSLVEDNLGFKLSNNFHGIYFVRNVAPNKDMYRVSFYLTEEILLSQNSHKRQIDTSSDPICNKKVFIL